MFIFLAQQGIEGLSSRARKLIADKDNDLLMSAVSMFEIATTASINELAINATEAC